MTHVFPPAFHPPAGATTSSDIVSPALFSNTKVAGVFRTLLSVTESLPADRTRTGAVKNTAVRLKSDARKKEERRNREYIKVLRSEVRHKVSASCIDAITQKAKQCTIFHPIRKLPWSRRQVSFTLLLYFAAFYGRVSGGYCTGQMIAVRCVEDLSKNVAQHLSIDGKL